MDGYQPNGYNNYYTSQAQADNQQANSYMNFEQFISQYNSIYFNNYPNQPQYFQHPTSNGMEYGAVATSYSTGDTSTSNLTALAEELVPRVHKVQSQPQQPESEIHNTQSDNHAPQSASDNLPLNNHVNVNVQSKASEESKRQPNKSRGRNTNDTVEQPHSSRNNNYSSNYNGSNNNGNGTGAVKKGYKNYDNRNDSKQFNNNGYSGRSNRYNNNNNNNNNDYNYSDNNPRKQNRSNSKHNYHQDQYYDYNDNRRHNKYHNNGDNYSTIKHRNEHDISAMEKKAENSPHKTHSFNKKFEDFAINLNENNNCSQREKLIQEIESDKLECLVCCEKIRPTQSVWSCSNCFHILHLNCTAKWGNSSKSEDGWRCPACQNINKNIPNAYYCFCGKQKNPQYNRNHDIAHSCGSVCNRNNFCDHVCTLLCHPGPCPLCQASVVKFCGCGKTTKTLQCSQRESILCGNVCDKLLACLIHNCKELCHVDECAPCETKHTKTCFCKKESKEVDCTKENNAMLSFACTNICNRLLLCGNHNCEQLCHEGDCLVCPLSPNIITSCPCGKMPIAKGERKSCLDPIIECKNVCGKQFACGPIGAHHTCASRCHQNKCPPCNKKTTVKCRCGNMDQEMKCKSLKTRADDARCKKKCPRFRNCAKHKCNQECCIDIDHICPLTCSKTLSCGKHKCDKMCHKGLCTPCSRTSFNELTCECGASVIYPPVPCGTKKPECLKTCKRQHNCDHPVLHNCHSATVCPPCCVLTTKYCHGKHETRKTIPCNEDSFSCGLPCNKPLPCKRHKCIKICHMGDCYKEGEVCKQSCQIERIECQHPCNAPCHDGQCPEIACKDSIEVTCPCSNLKQIRKCYDFAKEYHRIATAKLASSMQEMQRGGSIELSDILGPVKINNKKALECNEECRQLDRNRRITIAFNTISSDPTPKAVPNYSEFLRQFGKKDPHFVQNIHDKLTELVNLARDSKQKSRSFSFPIMNRDKRHVVHEMCEMFRMESVAYDAEPNRNIVATANRYNCVIPTMSLMEVIQRENGQRKVPVPMNAWGLKK